MSLLSQINKYAGVYLFSNANTLTYNIFNYIYNKNIINLKDADEDIYFFHENGFFKPNINFKKEIKLLKCHLDENNISEKNDFSYKFNLNLDARNIIRNILISDDFKKLKKKLENYFNLKMYLINTAVSRNFDLNVSKENEHKIKYYSNNYHVDFYLINYFKIFINMHDVDETRGPMHLFSKINSKKFVKKSNFKDRNNYSLEYENKLGMIKNIGMEGDVFVCSTPQCLHRASSPNKGKYRDMLFLSFAVTSDVKDKPDDLLYFEKDYEKDIWEGDAGLRKKLCKPKSFRKQIKIFKNFNQSKLTK
jgi:hypothetical protein